jgi:hypothetical protein
MTEVEEELLEASGFKPKRKYADRQDYLAALARAVYAMPEADFDALTNEAVDWYTLAARAINSQTELPDFEASDAEAEGVVAEETTTDVEGEGEPDDNDEPLEDEPEPAPPRYRQATPTNTTIIQDGEIQLELDKYGIVVGSKNHEAACMFEQGVRMSEVKATIGGTYYNLLNRLKRYGHHVIQEDHGVLRLVHIDEYGAKARGKRE